jgi:hypothetical protein
VQTNVWSQLTGLLPEPEATKDGVGETMTQWPRRICLRKGAVKTLQIVPREELEDETAE